MNRQISFRNPLSALLIFIFSLTPVFSETGNTGFLSLSGSRGLISIPVPVSNKNERVIVAAKTTQSQTYSYKIRTTEFNETLEENRYQLCLPVTPDAEIVFTQVDLKKEIESAGVKSNENHKLNSFGAKFTGSLEEKADFCVGFHWASGDNDGLRYADLETISLARNIFATFSTKVKKNLLTHLHLKQSYTPEFKTDLADGRVVTIDAQNFTSGGVGIERFFGSDGDASAMIELNYSDYQSFSAAMQKEFQLSAGVRFRFRGFGVEISGRSLTDTPAVTAGVNLAY
jgi:hypothetical protein